MSKAQFDKEFSIYQESWKLLVELRAVTLSLRPPINFEVREETEGARIERMISSFEKAFFAFRYSMENNRPFYAHSVYESLLQIFNLCHAESIAYQYKEPGSNIDFWRSSKENYQKIVGAIDSCCELIRNRISSLSVVQ